MKLHQHPITMNITKDCAVTLRLKVSDAQGQVIESGKEPVSYLHGGYGNLIAKLEEALEGQTVGFKGSWLLTPADAFGERDETLVQTIAKSDFPPGVKVGGQLEGSGPDGSEMVFTVVKIKGPQVILDGNHPLAGKTLNISAQVLEVRAASSEEIAHGHVHGAHGHQH
jgi:FKBP-type peptidyl-prolyl cis-trans isomerase SlyD